ncbi:microtubule-associated tumor suppressor 1 homolog A isoform X2 [Amphiprion ocellaris]|uniref:Microtubule associated tumor suppressor 1b n=1 Tax=Amphiprion ocellaris TaxID=80972 RepID=A0A3Q1BJU5_AMPOC|nr:microtubule-associated tumor suppressor 1 homolog A isoform X2 [Amphiprion ocellaris]
MNYSADNLMQGYSKLNQHSKVKSHQGSKMSNKTFTSGEDESTVPLSDRGLQLVLSPESPYMSMSASPDSSSSISNLSDREASSSPDINMLQCCRSDLSPVDNLYNNTLMQDDVHRDVATNLNQTFIATPVNGSISFWNENLRSNEEDGSEKTQTFIKYTDDECNSAVMSPDFAGRDSQLSSCETSCRGSVENDCCSQSSGEMVVRHNSLCVEDQSRLVVSSLENSFISPDVGCPALSAESNLLSTTHVCEKSTERVSEENTGHSCLGVTFTQADNWALLTDEDDIPASDSLVALPSENEGGLLMTFICETSDDSRKEIEFASAETELSPQFLGAVAPEQGKTFFSPLPDMQESTNDIYTSTPVQNIENKTPSLPSFSESPCTGNTSSPSLNPANRQQTTVAPKQRLVTGQPPSASKFKKFEIKKFPKSDFSSVKSKVVTRAAHHLLVPVRASQHKPSQVNVNDKHPEAPRGTAVRISPTKVRSSTAVVSATPKMFSDAQKEVTTGAANVEVTVVVDGHDKSTASPPDHHSDATGDASAVHCSNANSEAEQAASSQISDPSAQHAGNSSSLKKSPHRSGQIDPKPTPKKGMSNKIQVRSGAALGQDKPAALKTRPRCSSESSSSASRPPKERPTVRFSTTFIIPKPHTHQGQTKPGNVNCSSQNKQDIQAEKTNDPREVKKISLVAESSKSATAAAPLDDRNRRFRGQPSPRQARRTALPLPPAASPRLSTLSARQRPGVPGRDECRTKSVGTPQSKQKISTGSQRSQGTGEPPLGAASAASIKAQLNGSRPPQTPTRPSLMGPPLTPACRLHKSLGPSRGLTEASVHSQLGQGTGNPQVSGGAAHKPTSFKSVVLKAQLVSTPGKTPGPTLTTACKPAASTVKGASNSVKFKFTPLKRTSSARLVQPSGPVDKNKSKASSRQQQPSQQSQNQGPSDVLPASVTKDDRKDTIIQNLKGLLTASNRRFEAVAVVLQQTLAERDEASRQCRELSQELVNLRGELVCSVHSSERLEKEKEDLRVSLEDALQNLQEQHQQDLAELEKRLQAFYQAEWDKVHLTYQEEADKCKTLMQQQMEELKANHEAMKLELENSHVEQLQCVKQQYEMSLEELRKVHNQELQSLDKTLKDAEAALSGQIQELTVENNALIEKLTAEENRRKDLADKTQDSHTLYLEQELESLKVVLDIKNKQLHQQEKKLMEIDKLTEKNVKLDESLKKVQQENEDFKARMERHAALSRQLSTEQAMLQESLQKESKVNKRLSMENEELLWKLHNGDLSSPRKVSPTSPSPSHSFSLQSPRSSGLFSSPPVSPR